MSNMRIGHGYDVHRFGDGDSIVLCGVRIPHSHALLAHSDGDVAIHALCDALLGALALGDIGKHFPDTDSAYKGAGGNIAGRPDTGQREGDNNRKTGFCRSPGRDRRRCRCSAGAYRPCCLTGLAHWVALTSMAY